MEDSETQPPSEPPDSPAPDQPALAPSSLATPSLATWLATGLGVGLWAPAAPGTFGALWGLPLAWAYSEAGPVWGWGIAVAVILLGVPICQRGAIDLAMKDPGPVVWDEFATVPLVFLLVPMSTWWIALVGFGLHRLFDITKPWPCKRLEQLPGGWGIMMDDVAAAIYGAVVLWGLSWLW